MAMVEAHKPKSPRQKFFAGMAVVGAIAVLMLVLTWTGLIYQWQMFGVDWIISEHQHDSLNIQLVEITDEDYKNLFGNTSPLNQNELAKLIAAVAAAHPQVVLIDLDISDPPTGGMTQAQFTERVDSAIAALPQPHPLLIWTQTTGRADSSHRLTLGPLMQGIPEDHLALPLFPRGHDGVVRSYLRTVRVSNGGVCQRWPTLAWAAFTRGQAPPEACSEKSENEESLYLNFNGDRFTFPRVDASSILSVNPSTASAVLGGKFVIIGGGYAAARDEYFTPGGQKQGMELIAFALQSELDHEGIRPVDELYALIFDLALGAVILSLGFWLRGWPSLLSAFGAAVLLPILGSYLVYKTQNFLLNFVPVALGALLHIAWEAFHSMPRAGSELKEKESALTELSLKNQELQRQLDRQTTPTHEPQPIVTVNVVQSLPKP